MHCSAYTSLRGVSYLALIVTMIGMQYAYQASAAGSQPIAARAAHSVLVVGPDTNLNQYLGGSYHHTIFEPKSLSDLQLKLGATRYQHCVSYLNFLGHGPKTKSTQNTEDIELLGARMTSHPDLEEYWLGGNNVKEGEDFGFSLTTHNLLHSLAYDEKARPAVLCRQERGEGGCTIWITSCGGVLGNAGDQLLRSMQQITGCRTCGYDSVAILGGLLGSSKCIEAD